MTDALKVTSLADEIRRRGSDRLVNLPVVTDVTDDLYNVCDVLPQEPTSEQIDDLAVRMSNFLEDAHRCHVDRRHSVTDELGALAPPMIVPIAHRGRMKEKLAELLVVPPLSPSLWPTERETFCMLYLNVPRWTGATRAVQLAKLDEVARLHGLRCVDAGAIPQD